MKKVSILGIFLLCIVLIICGRFYWHHKINTTAVAAKATLAKTITDDEQTNVGAEDPDTESDSEPNDEQSANGDLTTLTQNLPDELQQKITKAVEEKKTLTLVIAGGQSTAPLSALLQTDLDQAYGKGLFKVTQVNFGEHQSLDVLHNELYQPIIEAKADVVIYTPTLINDIGLVNLDDSLVAIRMIHDDLLAALPDLTFFVQPPNPVTNAAFLSDRVVELSDFVEEKGYLYLNHLDAWPDESESLAGDLSDDEQTPNAKGSKLWADYLAGYFRGQTPSALMR